jgi:hypothetical protein
MNVQRYANLQHGGILLKENVGSSEDKVISGFILNLIKT